MHCAPSLTSFSSRRRAFVFSRPPVEPATGLHFKSSGSARPPPTSCNSPSLHSNSASFAAMPSEHEGVHFSPSSRTVLSPHGFSSALMSWSGMVHCAPLVLRELLRKLPVVDLHF